jgi:hypothetical protein
VGPIVCLRRTAVLLTAIACLLGQGAGLAHLVLVRHATCVEHDALVHTSNGTPALARPRAGAAGPVVASVPAEASHEDDHCLVAGCRRDLADPRAHAVGAVVVGFADPSPPASRPSPPPSPVPLLRLAPKSSPPALTV